MGYVGYGGGVEWGRGGVKNEVGMEDSLKKEGELGFNGVVESMWKYLGW